jgi:hypothetical protein
VRCANACHKGVSFGLRAHRQTDRERERAPVRERERAPVREKETDMTIQ